MRRVKISVLSGKGGTGKTTVSVNLAKTFNNSLYVDCDVEEPNGYLFLNPQIEDEKTVKVVIPEINYDKCTLCGECVKACRFGALTKLIKKILVFDHLCHSCGACFEMCHYDAIVEKYKPIGTIRKGKAQSVDFIDGKLNYGEATGVPILKEINKLIENVDKPVIVDSPPGTSCPVIHSIEGSDLCILVTEPTPYGMHDFDLAVQLVKQMGIPMAAVINKAGEGDNIIEEYCEKEGIKVLAKIPFKKEFAEAYSKGKLLIEVNEEVKGIFEKLTTDALGLIKK
ncbi:ATP-binding protein [Thermoanaerobacter sp. RKWS2]|uniref:ATP-binding protein n=1 Tax=Thermoanaerobacter sp. RKWS2 TaxID=2983842 RepID=UPI00224AF8BE|nr:ATP-binding protein [Thermoanaerobacter sp. RKWS2]MDI3311204.1 ATP-binding protein [Thermoanaerobacterium sp.]UZQ82341.1 ATP-binding protein [Thermoanaerobacter sp. RKWS2]